jgi:hypothetical protein
MWVPWSDDGIILRTWNLRSSTFPSKRVLGVMHHVPSQLFARLPSLKQTTNHISLIYQFTMLRKNIVNSSLILILSCAEKLCDKKGRVTSNFLLNLVIVTFFFFFGVLGSWRSSESQSWHRSLVRPFLPITSQAPTLLSSILDIECAAYRG